MDFSIRPAEPADAEACGRICFDAFLEIAKRHGFPPDWPTPEAGAALLSAFISHPHFYGVVAELDGSIVGSNFLDERSAITGLGPITVDPSVQDGRIGRALMLDALERASSRGSPGVRLVQAAYHVRSLCLYAKLGFEAREMLSCLRGPPLGTTVPGHVVRPASIDDVEPAAEVCYRVHGFDRSLELRDAIDLAAATVVEYGGRVTGYATSIGFAGHAVADTNLGLIALIGAAEKIEGPGLLLPTRNGPVLRWCLERGLRVTQQMTLMSVGLYTEPAGAYTPSVLL